MRTPIQPPSPRRDSVLDQQLTLAQQDAFYEQIEKGLSYANARNHLREQHGISLSAYSIWRWATRRRRVNSDLTFANLLETVKADKDHATALSRELGGGPDLQAACVLLAGQMLFEAQRNRDIRGVSEAAKVFAAVSGAVNQTCRVAISAGALQAARDRFRFDAAQAALTHVADLKEINACEEIDQRARIDRAIDRLFGPALAPPEPIPALPAS